MAMIGVNVVGVIACRFGRLRRTAGRTAKTPRCWPSIMGTRSSDPSTRTVDRIWTSCCGFEVEPLSGQPRPQPRLRGLDRGLVLEEIDPVIRQRVAAYAVVVSEPGLLATEYSDRTAVAERWGMPGGGIDDHEEPDEAVLREVAEETSQRSNSAS